MQNPDDSIEKALELDPVVDLNYEAPPEEVVRKGPLEKSIFVLGSDSFGDKNIAFNGIVPPSLTTVTDRNLRIQYSLYVHVQFSATNANRATQGKYPFCNAVAGSGVARKWPCVAGAVGAPVTPAYVTNGLCYDPMGNDDAVAAGNFVGESGVNGIGNTICLRAFPLQSCMSTCDIRVNGNSNSINMIDLISMQPYLLDDQEVEYFASEFPCQRDSSSLYSSSDGFDVRNPLSSAGANPATMTRASYNATLVYENVTAAGGLASVVYRVYRYDITESIIISPLVWGKCFGADGFANIQNLTLSFNIQDINRAFTIVPGVLTAPTVVTISTQGLPWGTVGSPDRWTGQAQNKCNILMNYYTQDPLISARMGTTLFYDYDYIQSDANGNAIPAVTNASPDGSWTGNALRVNTIPDKICVYIKPNKGQFNGTPTSATFPDTFLRIKKLNVGFNNAPSKLNTYTEADLYRMSVKNGLRMSWHEWRYSIGSLVIIDVVNDLGLGSEESSGQNKINSLKIDGEYSASPLAYAGNTAGFTVEVMTVVITQGKMTVSPQSAQFTVGGITTSDVLALTTTQSNVVASGLRHHLGHHSRGGNFLTKVGKLLHHGLQYAKKVQPHHLDMAQKGLENLGLHGGNVVAGAVSAGKLRKHKRVL
ncbi:MAG: hypothetical protein JSS98_06135 [Bacteroidetes bacterium]|nr:hypothetical protein [Bacteroidota bacterium]